LPSDLSLEDALRWIVDQPEAVGGRKVLLVLDQFEQWLHEHRAEREAPLVRALLACDGGRLQCLFRVEFLLAMYRLADVLEIDWHRGRNMELLDLFDPEHARKVLAEFGRSYERLPADLTTMTQPQEHFLEQAVAALKVMVCADLFKSGSRAELAV